MRIPDPKPQGLLLLAVESVKLLGAGIEQGNALEDGLGLLQVQNLKQAKLGYLWLAGD